MKKRLPSVFLQVLMYMLLVTSSKIRQIANFIGKFSCGDGGQFTATNVDVEDNNHITHGFLSQYYHIVWLNACLFEVFGNNDFSEVMVMP